MPTINVNGNTINTTSSGKLGQGYVPDLVTLKALPASVLIPYLKILVTNYDGTNIPAEYIYYEGTTNISDGEPNVVILDDSSGYFLLLAASPSSPNT